MPSPRPRPSRRRRPFLVVLLAVAIAAGAGFWLTTRADDGTGAGTDASAATTTQAPDPGGELATLPPERTGGAPISTDPPADVATDTPPPTDDADGEVAPQLTYYGWSADAQAVEAGGIVMGVVEAGGTCTLTLSRDTATVDVSSTAIDNVTSTSCPAMVVPGDQLGSGTWEAVLSYESATSRGVGEAVEVEIP